MIPERWRRIEAVFTEAAELPPDQRRAFLERACGLDSDLRREVETLLFHDGRDEAIRCAVDAVAELVSDDCASPEETPMEGARIGPYQVTGLVGHGGMGAVYRAIRADDEYRKLVAIKLVKRGLDTEEVLARFRRERQILASLEHPHIARLLDGGTTNEGLPYFVMEYVDDGLAITAHCDRLRLNVEERLRLFLQVCDAVRHAHRNLVVHRDLKPSNILVDKDGIPKLLDFGIAKLLHAEPGGESEHYTRTGMRLLTPEYASPEQVRGETVSTATDVYSLGVILFELLTGQPAQTFKDRSDADILRVVCLTEIEKPSVVAGRLRTDDARRRRQLERRLQGDLDAIVLRAMRKEPEHRYESVEQLAEDIRRHLEGLPVRARKGTSRYRAAKFVSRHKLAAVAALMVGASLVAGSMTTAWQARRAEQQARLVQVEAERSHRRFQQVRGLARTVLFDFHEQIRDLPGSTVARETLVKVALEYLDSLAKEAAGDDDLQWELAEAYDRVAKVQGAPNYPNLGQRGAAMESFRKSIGILEALRGREPESVRVLKSLHQGWENLAALQAHLGGTRASVESYRQSAAYGEQYAAKAPAEPGAMAAPGRAHFAMADNARRFGDKKAALEGFQKALLMHERWAARQPENPDAQRAIASQHERLGLVYQEIGDLARAEGHSRRAMTIAEAVASSRHATPRDQNRLALVNQRMGDVHGHPRLPSTGKLRTARRYYAKKNEICLRLAASDPRDMQAREELAYSFYELGTTWREENPAQAETLYRKAYAIAQEMTRRTPESVAARSFAAQVQTRLAAAMFRCGKREEGLTLARRAVDGLEKVAAKPGGPAGEKHHLGAAHASLAELLARTGDTEGARRHYRTAAAAVKPLVEASQYNAGARLARVAWQSAADRIEARSLQAAAGAGAGR